DQRFCAFGRRDRRTLPPALADRAVVSLVKQHLKICAFLGRCENAVRLQIFAAMIAYLLLRIAAQASCSRLLAMRFADLARRRLFQRTPLSLIDKPPPRARPFGPDPNQLLFAYA